MISSSAAWTYQIPVTLPKTLSQQPRKEEGPLLLQRHQEDCEAVVRVVSQPANWQTHISSRTRGLSDFRLKSLLGFDPTTNIGRNINNSNNNTINNTNYGNENMSEWCYEEETPVNNRSVERRSSPYAFSEQFHSHYQLQQQQQLEEQLHFIENTHSLSLLEEKTCSASACRRSVNSIKCTFADCRRKFPSEEKMESHLQSHFRDRPFSCPIPNCNARFTRRDNMLQHYRRHEGKMRHQQRTE